jgi:O-antigen/teichoic acid export membrane protein
MVHATSIMGASRLLVAAMGYVGTIVIVKSTNATVYGQYALIFSVLGLIGVVLDLQMGRVIYRALAEDPDPSGVAGSYLQLRLAIGVVSYGLALGFVVVGNYPHDVVVGMSVAGVALLTGELLNPAGVLLTSRRLFVASAGSSVVGQLAQLLIVVALALNHVGLPLVTFSAAAIVNNVVVAFLQYRALSGAVRLRIRPRLRLWRAWTAEIALLAVGGALTVAYYRVDMVMLSKLGSFASVGYYSLGDKLSGLVGFLPYAYAGVAVATLVTTYSSDHPRFYRVFRNSMVLGLATAVGLVLVALSFVPEAVQLLYGGRYAQIDAATRWLVVGEAMHFVTILCFITLQATGRNRGYPAVVLGALVANVLVNLVVIPRYDYLGAAVVTAGTEVVVAGSMLILVGRIPETRPLPFRPFAVAVGAAIPAVILRVAVGAALPWPLLAALVAGVYVLGLHLLRVDGPGGLPALLRSARLGEDKS